MNKKLFIITVILTLTLLVIIIYFNKDNITNKLFSLSKIQTCKGQCIDINVTQCNGTIKSGLCSGPSNIKCCEPIEQSPNCQGVCINTSTTKCLNGVLQTGKCSGASNIKCCKPIVPSNKIILDGKEYSLDGVTVYNFNDNPNFSFYQNDKGWRKKSSRIIHNLVLHDSITDTAEKAMNVLLARELSVHFILDKDGTIYQALDPKDIAYHAQYWNNNTIGIELANLLDPKFASGGRTLHPKTSWSVSKGYWDLTKEQKKSLPILIKKLTEVYNIPNDVPRNPDNSIMFRGIGKPIPNLLKSAGTFKGVVAHGMFEAQRWDGNDSIQALYV
jgi:hypothetical protein